MESDFTHLFSGKESTKTTETVYHNRVNLTEFKEFNWHFFCFLNFFELLTFSKKSNEINGILNAGSDNIKFMAQILMPYLI